MTYFIILIYEKKSKAATDYDVQRPERRPALYYTEEIYKHLQASHIGDTSMTLQTVMSISGVNEKPYSLSKNFSSKLKVSNE